MYLYTSHDKDVPHGFDMVNYNCLSSVDMVNWRDEGIAFSLDNSTSFEGCHAWAQQVVALKNGSFAMYAAVRADCRGCCCCCCCCCCCR